MCFYFVVITQILIYTSLSLSDWSLSVGMDVDGSDAIQSQVPLAQLGNLTQTQIIAASPVSGVVSRASDTWVGLILSTPTVLTVTDPDSGNGYLDNNQCFN